MNVNFPNNLGTFFHFAFGDLNIIDTFTRIPVAVVESDANQLLAMSFNELIAGLSEGEEPLLAPKYVSHYEDLELLEAGDVEGIFQIGDEVLLTVMNQGINPSILQIVSSQFVQKGSTLMTIAEETERVEQVMAEMNQTLQINQERTLGNGETNLLLYYFYALLAMVCLLGSQLGFQKAVTIQADASPLAARRSVSPTKQLVLIVSDFLAAVTAQFLLALVSLVYFCFKY